MPWKFRGPKIAPVQTAEANQNQSESLACREANRSVGFLLRYSKSVSLKLIVLGSSP